MPEDAPPPVAEPPLTPDEVSERSFPTAFRGFDPVAVRAFLGQVADELARLQGQEGAAVATADSAAAAEAADAAEAEAAGRIAAAQAEAERLVREARERVATLGSAATSEAARVLDAANAEAARIRAGATDQLRSRTEEAETTAVRKLAEAEREAASIRVKAREEADEIIEAAKDRGREMVSEAQAARERMLADLAKRRRGAQAQLDHLRTARDRLLDTLKQARRSIDEMSARFEAAESATPGGAASSPAAVTTTPGAPTAETRTRAASDAGDRPRAASDAGDRPRAAATRGRAVSIGESPAPTTRPQIAAAQADAPAAAVETAKSASAHATGAPVPEIPSPPRPPTEERRSSALRILRRNRSPEREAAVPPLVGRESSVEGVRILAPTPTPPPDPEAPPGVASDVEAPSVAPTPPRGVPAVRPEAEALVDSLADAGDPDDIFELDPDPIELRLLVESVAEPAGEPGAEDEVASVPVGGPEEIRASIDDLFARIRADRAASVSAAREVLGGAGHDNGAPAESSRTQPAVAEPPAEAGPTAGDERWLQARDASVEPLVAQLTRRLKRALQDEQNATLDRLRTSRGKADVEGVLGVSAEQASPFARIAQPFLGEAARAGAARSPFGAVALEVDDLAAHLADDMASAVRSRVRQALASGDDLATLSDAISAVYREWKVHKVERLSTHYLVAAHERGGFLAHPEGTPLRWLVDDDTTCPDCDDNALAGPTPRGEAFPTGQVHPPAHLGCRCSLSPTPA